MRDEVCHITSVITDEQLGGSERLRDEKLRIKAAEKKVSTLERKVAVFEREGGR